jgi:hypothetical protein
VVVLEVEQAVAALALATLGLKNNEHHSKTRG